MYHHVIQYYQHKCNEAFDRRDRAAFEAAKAKRDDLALADLPTNQGAKR